jgi:hypothetical protein
MMATQYSIAAGGYYSTSGVPASALFTITFWMNLLTEPVNNTGIVWSIDSSTSQYAYFGTSGFTPATFLFDWAGSGSTHVIGPTLAPANWYKTAVVVNGTAATMYIGTAGQLLTQYNASANFTLPTGTLKLWLADSAFNNYWLNFRMASFKLWTAALTKGECEQELQSYVPQRTANLNRWYPMVHAETTDYSGQGRTLSGGTNATTAPGPPISWSRLRVPLLPWDPATTVWYAHYDTTSGELLSVGTVAPDPLPSGTALLELLGQPDLAMYEWSTSARAFVLKEGASGVDRVADLLADGTLASAWADLSGADSTAMQNRIGQMLGPHRTRLDFQSPDLE